MIKRRFSVSLSGITLKGSCSSPLALLINLFWVYLCFTLCRVLFILLNLSYYPDLTGAHFGEMFRGGLVFDTSAILYINALYILLMLFPFHYKERSGYHLFLKWWFIATNTVAVIMNLADAVYFPYSGRRTTTSVFSQFANENNLGGIIGLELLSHWYLVLFVVLLIYGLCKVYCTPKIEPHHRLIPYYICSTLCLLIAIPLTVFGMRGGIGRDVRPITVSNANQYVNRPNETAIVLNTPFSIFRTIGKKPFVIPSYFASEKELDQAFTPVHYPVPGSHFQPKNVVILILESFGREYIGSLNPTLDGGKYKGYAPFLDSLIAKSLVFDYSYANGVQSIDALPSALSGIPRFVEPFFLTSASLNKLTSVGSELKKKGYYTAFFHGARDGSMGFQAYTRATGYTDYFGREEYGNDKDFDGHWAIWDEEFLQFFSHKLSSFKQPFAVGLFTASSHHPYNVPDRYKAVYPPEGKLEIYKTIRYSDMALRKFFETASRQPWFKNTLFVLCADHTNEVEHQEYKTEMGRFSIPIIFYTPNGELKGHKEGISQQIDIMPTVLGYLGYDKPFVSFGCNLLRTPAADTYAVNYNNGIYQLIKGDYVIQFDGEKTIAVYAFKKDPLLKNNLKGRVPQQAAMERQLKGIIQQYMVRMNTDKLTVK